MLWCAGRAARGHRATICASAASHQWLLCSSVPAPIHTTLNCSPEFGYLLLLPCFGESLHSRRLADWAGLAPCLTHPSRADISRGGLGGWRPSVLPPKTCMRANAAAPNPVVRCNSNIFELCVITVEIMMVLQCALQGLAGCYKQGVGPDRHLCLPHPS